MRTLLVCVAAILLLGAVSEALDRRVLVGSRARTGTLGKSKLCTVDKCKYTPFKGQKAKDKDDTDAKSKWDAPAFKDGVAGVKGNPEGAKLLKDTLLALRDPKTPLGTWFATVQKDAKSTAFVGVDGKKVIVTVFSPKGDTAALPAGVANVELQAKKGEFTLTDKAALPVGTQVARQCAPPTNGATASIGACLKRRRFILGDVNDHFVTTFHNGCAGFDNDAVYKDNGGAYEEIGNIVGGAHAAAADWDLVRITNGDTCTCPASAAASATFQTELDWIADVFTRAAAGSAATVTGQHGVFNLQIKPNLAYAVSGVAAGYMCLHYNNPVGNVPAHGDSGGAVVENNQLVGIYKGTLNSLGVAQYDVFTPIWTVAAALPANLKIC